MKLGRLNREPKRTRSRGDDLDTGIGRPSYPTKDLSCYNGSLENILEIFIISYNVMVGSRIFVKYCV